MALSLQAGKTLSIPCRACGSGTILFTVTEGTHALTCSECQASTQVRVYRDGEEWRIATGNEDVAPSSAPPESPEPEVRLTPRKEKKMAKRKLSPQQRQELRKEMKRKLAAGRTRSEILKEASQKYAIAPETARYYLKQLEKSGRKPRGKRKPQTRARAQRSKKTRKGKKRRSAKKSSVRTVARGVGKAPFTLSDVSKNFSRRQLMRAATASELRIQVETIVGKERRVKDKQRELGRELRILAAARRKLESQIRRLAP